MIPFPAGVRVRLATGYTDMRKGFPSLALQVQEVLHRDPLSGHLFCFPSRRGNLLKVIWHARRLLISVWYLRDQPGGKAAGQVFPAPSKPVASSYN